MFLANTFRFLSGLDYVRSLRKYFHVLAKFNKKMSACPRGKRHATQGLPKPLISMHLHHWLSPSNQPFSSQTVAEINYCVFSHEFHEFMIHPEDNNHFKSITIHEKMSISRYIFSNRVHPLTKWYCWTETYAPLWSRRHAGNQPILTALWVTTFQLLVYILHHRRPKTNSLGYHNFNASSFFISVSIWQRKAVFWSSLDQKLWFCLKWILIKRPK